MTQKFPELVLPDSQATLQEIEMGEFEIIPGVNVPRDPSSVYHLSPRVGKKIDHCLKEDGKQNP